MNTSLNPKLFRALLLTLLTLLASAFTGCAAYTAANEEHPAARGAGGGDSHGAQTGHAH